MRLFFSLIFVRLLLAFLSCVPNNLGQSQFAGKQEYSSRTLGATWGIISAIMVPIVIVLICVAWRLLLRRKQEEKEENDFLTIKSRAIDPDESMKINSDDESIPYKKDIEEDSPEPTDPVRVDQPYADSVRVADSSQPFNPDIQPFNPDSQPYNPASQPFTYGQPVPPPIPGTSDQSRARQWAGETEIN